MREALLANCVEVDMHRELHLNSRWTSDDYKLGVRVNGTRLSVDGFDKLKKLLKVLRGLQPTQLNNVSWYQYQTLREEYPEFISRVRTIRWTASMRIVCDIVIRVRMVIGVDPHLTGFEHPLLQVHSKSNSYPSVKTIRATLHADSGSTGGGAPLPDEFVDDFSSHNAIKPDAFMGKFPECQDFGVITTSDVQLVFSPAITKLDFGCKFDLERLCLHRCTLLQSLTFEAVLPSDSLAVSLPTHLTHLKVRLVHRILSKVKLDLAVCPTGLKSLEVIEQDLVGSFEHLPHLKHLRCEHMEFEHNVVVPPQLDTLELGGYQRGHFVLPLLLKKLGLGATAPTLSCDEVTVLSDRLMDLSPLTSLEFIRVELSFPREIARVNLKDNARLEEIICYRLRCRELFLPRLVKRLHLIDCQVLEVQFEEDCNLKEAKFINLTCEIPSHILQLLDVFVSEGSELGAVDCKPTLSHVSWLTRDSGQWQVMKMPKVVDQMYLSYLSWYDCANHGLPKVRVLKTTRAKSLVDGPPIQESFDASRLEHLELHQVHMLWTPCDS